jgi:SAM-dependent methyltransferase
MDQEKEIARFFNCCETPSQRKMNTKISRKARRELIQAVREMGIEGRTVLDVGCGPGDLTRELLREGASRALGVDLAEQSLDEARKRAANEQLSERVEFRVGNGAKDELGKHDVVVLDKVICCYPNWRELIDNTSAAAGSFYGFIIPRSDGLNGFFLRAFVGLGNVFLRIRKCGYRAHVHDYRQIHGHLRDLDFDRKQLSMGPVWMTAVYARA